MRILTDNTGKGQLEILSVLAEEEGLRQKEVTENSSLSKGSVSSNVRNLKEKRLLKEENKELYLDLEKIKSYYREHLEGFLIRRTNEPDEMNEVRTVTKRRIEDIMDDRDEEIQEILRDILAESSNRDDIESLNTVFKEVDRIISETAEDEDFELIAVSTDLSSSTTSRETRNLERAKKVLEEVESNNG